MWVDRRPISETTGVIVELDLDPESEPVPERVILTSEDDGELIGYVGEKAGWRPETSEDIEWALGKRAEIEADLAAVRLRKAAVLENFKALERRHGQRLAGWDWRFRPDVIAFARKSLEGGKSKTALFGNGAIRFHLPPWRSPGMNPRRRFVDSARSAEIAR
jgi:hypothetical protein